MHSLKLITKHGCVKILPVFEAADEMKEPLWHQTLKFKKIVINGLTPDTGHECVQCGKCCYFDDGLKCSYLNELNLCTIYDFRHGQVIRPFSTCGKVGTRMWCFYWHEWKKVKKG